MKPRILYVGDLSPGGTCLERMVCLKECGYAVDPFDIRPFVAARNTVERILASRLAIGPIPGRLNRALVAAGESSETDWVWVDKGIWVWPATLDALKRVGKRRLIHYTPDPAFHVHITRHFKGGINRYDVLVTTKPYEVELYRRSTRAPVILSGQGFGRHLLEPVSQRDVEGSPYWADVSFVGHSETHYARMLGVAAEEGRSVAIWGPWGRRAHFSRLVRRCWRGRSVFGREHTLALVGGRISLGLLCKRYPDQITTRSFEIPATGTFMLAERTPEHSSAFAEGREAEFFRGARELRDKTRYYLANDEARRRIAHAGRLRALTSGYSWANRVNQILAQLEGL